MDFMLYIEAAFHVERLEYGNRKLDAALDLTSVKEYCFSHTVLRPLHSLFSFVFLHSVYKD